MIRVRQSSIASYVETFCRMIHGTSEPLLDVWQIELDTLGLHWTTIPINCLLMITEIHSMVLKELCILSFSVYTIDGIKHNRTICRNVVPGGFIGFGDIIWTIKGHKEDKYITFTYDSHDNEQGTLFDSLLIATNSLLTFIYFSLQITNL